MKFRSDFVTNSSSSSFTCIHFESPLIEGFLKEHKEVREGKKLEEILDDLVADIDGNGAGYLPDAKTPAEMLMRFLFGVLAGAASASNSRATSGGMQLSWTDGFSVPINLFFMGGLVSPLGLGKAAKWMSLFSGRLVVLVSRTSLKPGRSS